MEKKRRTINTSRNTRGSSKKVWGILGIILGIALIFFVSYKVSYGLFSPKDNSGKETQLDDGDTNVSELQEAIEAKDKEIDMLKERLEKSDDESKENSEEPSPSKTENESGSSANTPSASEAPKASSQPQESASAPAPAQPFSSGTDLISPEDLAALEQSAR